MNLTIERAVPEDAKELIQIQNAAFWDDFQRYGECPGYGKTQEKMLRVINNAFTFKIMANQKIVGDMIIKGCDGRYHLSGLCVIPEYQNKGIGQFAMEYLNTGFPDAVHWSLETPADRTRNHYFYMKFGFQITREYLKGKVNLVFLEKDTTYGSYDK